MPTPPRDGIRSDIDDRRLSKTRTAQCSAAARCDAPTRRRGVRTARQHAYESRSEFSGDLPGMCYGLNTSGGPPFLGGPRRRVRKVGPNSGGGVARTRPHKARVWANIGATGRVRRRGAESGQQLVPAGVWAILPSEFGPVFPTSLIDPHKAFPRAGPTFLVISCGKSVSSTGRLERGREREGRPGRGGGKGPESRPRVVRNVVSKWAPRTRSSARCHRRRST